MSKPISARARQYVLCTSIERAEGSGGGRRMAKHQAQNLLRALLVVVLSATLSSPLSPPKTSPPRFTIYIARELYGCVCVCVCIYIDRNIYIYIDRNICIHVYVYTHMILRRQTDAEHDAVPQSASF